MVCYQHSILDRTGGGLSLLVQPLSGSQGSLQSVGGEEQEMEEMTGDMENEMEPTESMFWGWD